MITHSFARTSDGTANYCIWPAQTDRQRMHVRETEARSRSFPSIPVRPHPSASVRSIKCKILTDFYCLSRFVSAVESTTRSENTRARARADRIRTEWTESLRLRHAISAMFHFPSRGTPILSRHLTDTYERASTAERRRAMMCNGVRADGRGKPL